jgi:uncharacterized protein YifN (PemK superfamily)
MNKNSIGTITLDFSDNVVASKVDLKQILWIKFTQFTATKLDKNGIPEMEKLDTVINKGTETEWLNFFPDSLQHLKVKGSQTNRRTYHSSGQPWSVNSMIHNFISGRMASNKDYFLFINDQFPGITVTNISNTTARVMDHAGQFEIMVNYKYESNYRIPVKIDLKKYKVYGINWNIFNLALLEYSLK